MRFDFASQTQTIAEKFVGTEATGGTCVGCHALSRDGKKLVAEAGGQNDGRVLLARRREQDDDRPVRLDAEEQLRELEPRRQRVRRRVRRYTGATNYNLMMFDGTTGVVDRDDRRRAARRRIRRTIPTGRRSVIASRTSTSASMNTLQMMYNGEIRTVAKTGGTWAAPQALVPRAAGKNRYYPAFAPDGQMLVFNESTCNSGNTGGELQRRYGSDREALRRRRDQRRRADRADDARTRRALTTAPRRR